MKKNDSLIYIVFKCGDKFIICLYDRISLELLFSEQYYNNISFEKHGVVLDSDYYPEGLRNASYATKKVRRIIPKRS